MNQLIPNPLAIIFICVFAWGIGFFLLRFSEKVKIEADQNQSAYSVKLDISQKEFQNWKQK